MGNRGVPDSESVYLTALRMTPRLVCSVARLAVRSLDEQRAVQCGSWELVRGHTWAAVEEVTVPRSFGDDS